MTRFVRYFSSFTFFAWTKAEEAAWRLSGTERDASTIRLFDYGVCQSTCNNTKQPSTRETATEADTNIAQSNSLPSAFHAKTWIVRTSRVIDDQLLAFLGTWSVALTGNQFEQPIKTTLLDLIDRCPLEVTVRMHQQIVVEIRQHDLLAKLLYSRHMESRPPPTLKVWLYLEGDQIEEVR